MSGQARKGQYLDLIRNFTDSEVGARAFVDAYDELWRLDMEDYDAKERQWPRAFRIELINAFQGGEISADEFSEKMAILGGYSEDVPFEILRGMLYSACDCFVKPEHSLDRSREYDEDELRAYVLRRVNEYRAGTLDPSN